jgi:hypothetical protein
MNTSELTPDIHERQNRLPSFGAMEALASVCNMVDSDFTEDSASDRAPTPINRVPTPTNRVPTPTNRTPNASSLSYIVERNNSKEKLLEPTEKEVESILKKFENIDLKLNYVEKPKRKRASTFQVTVLAEIFKTNQFPSTELRNILAKKLSMSPRTIQIWFQNKRQTWKSSLALAQVRSKEKLEREGKLIVNSPGSISQPVPLERPRSAPYFNLPNPRQPLYRPGSVPQNDICTDFPRALTPPNLNAPTQSGPLPSIHDISPRLLANRQSTFPVYGPRVIYPKPNAHILSNETTSLIYPDVYNSDGDNRPS